MAQTTPIRSDRRTPLDDETRALIDELMSGPIKPFPQIIVVGDDAVSGFTPAPQPAAKPPP
jgi:hypothetical protein